MKILIVSSFMPYPLFSGGQIRLYNLIREISSKHELTLICEIRDNQSGADIAEVEKICKKVITVKREKQWSVGNLLKTTFSSNSFLVTGHISREMKQKITDELENEKYELIHVETYYIMQNLLDTSLPVVLAEHNIEYQVYGRYVDQALPLIKPILRLDIAKIRKEEESCWKKADKLIAVSDEDRRIMSAAGLKPVIVANGVETEKFGFIQKAISDKQKNIKILFMGEFKWIQNRDSAQFIIEEIWPQVSSKFKAQSSKFDIKLWVVGRKIPDSIKNLSPDTDIMFDEVSSSKPTEQLFYEADVLLAPIRVGGGTSYKIIESMSCGTPVVTMPLSAEALGAKDNEEIMVGKDSGELAEKTLKILSNKNLYEKLSKNGRKFIEKNYKWEKIARDLDAIYEELRIKN